MPQRYATPPERGAKRGDWTTTPGMPREGEAEFAHYFILGGGGTANPMMPWGAGAGQEGGGGGAGLSQ